MGNLHAGHLALVDRARQVADKVVVSIFVNPAQFGPNEDFDRYPRTLEQDSECLIQHDTDLLFNPSVETMYGDGGENMMVHVPDELNNMLCGLSRPGHFDGVATVVAKLLNQVQADIAIFGEKDYQQLIVIRRLVRDLAFPIEVMGHETMREADGLAMSSRNNYLTAEERTLAPQLQQALKQLTEQLKTHPQEGQTLINELRERLSASGFGIEYVEIRRQSDLKIPEPEDNKLIALIAARLGQTRLIDNRRFELE
jgi:pantoate--beta-alanine ligase